MPPFAPPDGKSVAPTFRKKSIFDWKVQRSGFAYSAALEWDLCAHWWRLSIGEWDALAQEEQERCLAVYRCNSQIEAIRSEPRYAPPQRGKRRG